MTRTPSLWEGDRMSLERSIALTIESLHAYGPLSRHWAVAYSGGKDSTATVTLIAHLIAAGQIAPPETLTVLSAHPTRLGPYTMEARRAGLAAVLTIQDEVNQVAHTRGRPHIDLINAEEHARILALIEADTWPDRWTGQEVRGDVLIPQVIADGIMQPLLGGELYA